MGMNLPLGNLYAEDTVLLTAEMFADSDLINQTRERYAEYLSSQRFKACRIGIPYVVEDRVYDPSAWLGPFLHELPVKASWFFYMDMSLRHDISRWTWSFPEIGDSRTLYIKCSRGIQWDNFLSSIWDFVKNNVNVVLLDTNKVLHHSKNEKIMQSLILRGVALGFYGEFPVSWWQRESSLIKKISSLNLVDFWQTKNFSLHTPECEKEIKRKQCYFAKNN
jgi:hypothetical protein